MYVVMVMSHVYSSLDCLPACLTVVAVGCPLYHCYADLSVVAFPFCLFMTMQKVDDAIMTAGSELF